MSDPALFCLCLCLYLCLCHCVLSFVLCVFPNVGHLSVAAKPYSTQVGKKIGNIKERWKILFFFHRVPRQKFQSRSTSPYFPSLTCAHTKKYARYLVLLFLCLTLSALYPDTVYFGFSITLRRHTREHFSSLFLMSDSAYNM